MTMQGSNLFDHASFTGLVVRSGCVNFPYPVADDLAASSGLDRGAGGRADVGRLLRRQIRATI
jgi:hypothetical protein